MKIKIIFEQDSESTYIDWKVLEKKIAGWVQTSSATFPSLGLAGQNRTIVLEFKGDDIISAVRNLHEELYDSQVNCTLSFF